MLSKMCQDYSPLHQPYSTVFKNGASASGKCSVVFLFLEPRCFGLPTSFTGTDQRYIDDKTVEYNCQEGFTGDMDKVTVKCETPDADRTPWTWSDSSVEADLNCEPGK